MINELIIDETHRTQIIGGGLKRWLLGSCLGGSIFLCLVWFLLGEPLSLKSAGLAIVGSVALLLSVFALIYYPIFISLRLYMRATKKRVIFRIDDDIFHMQRGSKVIIHAPVSSIKSYIFVQIQTRTSLSVISEGNSLGDLFRIKFQDKNKTREMQLKLMRWQNEDRLKLRLWLMQNIPIERPLNNDRS